MRILHVNKFLHRRGGAEGYMLDLADLQQSAGHTTAYFGMEHPDNDRSSVGRPAPYVEFEPAPPKALDKLARLGRMVWSAAARDGMELALAEFRPDVVHAHNVYHQLSPSVLHAAARRGVPVVLTMHDYKLVCPTYRFLDHGNICTACVEGGPWQAARRACKDGQRVASAAAALEVSIHRRFGAYDGVRCFLAPSRFLADQVIAGGVYPDRVVVQPNFTETDLPWGLAPTTGAVFAGRLSREKGVDTLIRAVGRVAAGPASRGVLLDVAGDGPERAALEALAAAVAPGLVRFHGRLDRAELQRLVGSATLSVVPSRWLENQPLAVLESFALGVPVLTTDLGGLPELVDAASGWVVPADDERAMAAALQEALADPSRARVLGAQGRRRVEEQHDPKSHVEAITDIYRRAGAPS